jgi:SprT protein
METAMNKKIVVINRVHELMEKFRNECYDFFGKYPIYEPVNPVVKFNIKGTVGGYSDFNIYGEGSVRFNPIIMEDNWSEYDQTVIHEVAHYCTNLLYGIIYKGNRRVIHGTEWKQMMKFFGAKTNRCHKYNVERAKLGTRTQRKWEYRCGCSTHMVSTTLHNKMCRGQVRICTRCKDKIRYVG